MASCVQRCKQPQLQLHKLIEELVSINNWQLLMLLLGMEASRIKIIERDYRDLAKQKHQAFDKWLSMTPSACWKNVIEALRKEPMSENNLALDLERKYAWTDPRTKSVTRNLVCLPHTNNRVNFIQSKELEERHFYRVYSTGDVPLLRSRGELAGTVKRFSRLISNSKPINLTNFVKQIEESDSKYDFRVGIEARFGELNLKLFCDANKLRPRKLWEVLQMINDSRCTFQPRVETTDIDRLLAGQNFLAEIKSLRVTFEITGQHEGEFVAIIDEHDDIFHLDVVYRQPGVRNKARFNFAMTQRKYDFRIADASRSILHERENSTPSQIAREIESLIRRLGQKQLSLSVCGKANDGQSEWKIQHVRQCIQKQYEWRPEKKWILVRYDIGETAPSTIDDQTPINDHATITFPIFKNEIELWGLKRFPKGADRTHLSKKKYYYCPEHGDSYEWTTDDIMRDFNDFLEESFVIALKLDRSLPNK